MISCHNILIVVKLKHMIDNLLYTMQKENHTKDQIIEILFIIQNNVSFVGIDLSEMMKIANFILEMAYSSSWSRTRWINSCIF